MVWKVWLANIILAAAVFFAGMKAIETWTEKRAPKTGSPQHVASDWPERLYEKKQIFPEAEYEVIVQDNLFFQDRSEPQENPEASESSAAQAVAVGRQLQMVKQSAKQVNLYGILITEDAREAFIGDVGLSKPGAAPEAKIIRTKVGDVVGGFTVKEIHRSSVVLAAGGHEWEIVLFDKDRPKERIPIKRETGPVVVGGAEGPETGRAPEAAKPAETGAVQQPLPGGQVPKRPLPGEIRGPSEVHPVPNKDPLVERGQALQPIPAPVMISPERR